MHTKDSMELNFEGLEKQKLYTNVMQNEISQSDIAQNEMRYSLDEKKWVIYLVIMFILGVMIIKMSQVAHCLYFLLMTEQKVSHTLRKNNWVHLKDLI